LKQEHYAKVAARIVNVLKRQDITVTAFCTDGLKLQVNALNGMYRGFNIQFICFFRKVILLKEKNQ
jgi:hypothetical protein